MGKSLEHKNAPRTCFFMRGLGGLVRLVGLVGGPLEEGGFSDGSDWAEAFSRGPPCEKRKIPRLWGEVRDGLIC